jgi:hypothetical protein
VNAAVAPLREALRDGSRLVRIVAAQALAQDGPPAELAGALAALRELLPPAQNGFFVSTSALAAVEALGPKGVPLHEVVRTMNPEGPAPDARYDSYIPRQIANLTGAPAPTAEGEGARKAKGRRKNAKD